ncbi:hypothetical protein [Vaginisenegalia massiliensis]|uniref:hypothetical protein n=1 Tax=Vaginisenegalia massiliensis TaxID=2058294 RepID=UPI000F5436F2|nr:hypothetical protein [Vaginisenegalia massiliensis]
MSRFNLYIHYDSVTNHIMTRGIDLLSIDFDEHYLPNNLILAEAPAEYGRFDAQTNFKMLRGRAEVTSYMQTCEREHIRMSNWIDFETIEMMHQLTPTEVAELLYLFHANMSLRSAFFYKLQNNFVYLTLPNGLNKVYYRHMVHFYPRFRRVIREKVFDLVNEGKNFIFARKEKVAPFPPDLVEDLAPLFASGLKVNFSQAFASGSRWIIPLMIIEDELTLLTQQQDLDEQEGFISYDLTSEQWQVTIGEAF